MTVVLARRFDKRIIVMSDTMISSRDGTPPNVFPGRLKSIVVNDWLTISYAGLSTQAVDVIRHISKIPHLTINSAISYLLGMNSFHNDKIDFIVCSHETEARLLKISNGAIYDGEDHYWIGNPTAVNEISKNQQKLPKSEKFPDYIAHEE